MSATVKGRWPPVLLEGNSTPLSQCTLPNQREVKSSVVTVVDVERRDVEDETGDHSLQWGRKRTRILGRIQDVPLWTNRRCLHRPRGPRKYLWVVSTSQKSLFYFFSCRSSYFLRSEIQLTKVSVKELDTRLVKVHSLKISTLVYIRSLVFTESRRVVFVYCKHPHGCRKYLFYLHTKPSFVSPVPRVLLSKT